VRCVCVEGGVEGFVEGLDADSVERENAEVVFIFKKGASAKCILLVLHFADKQKVMKCNNPYPHEKYGFLPCGQCRSCRANRSREWQVRMLHESFEWKYTCFITLTYAILSKDYTYDFRLWRENMKNKGYWPFKFVGVKELGSKKGRPHFHVILFTNKEVQYVDVVESWQKGFCSVSPATTARMRYLVKYITKDSEMRLYCSRTPGIGFSFYSKLWKVFPSVDEEGKMHVPYIIGPENKAPMPCPRYYRKKFGLVCTDLDCRKSKEKPVGVDELMTAKENLYRKGALHDL